MKKNLAGHAHDRTVSNGLYKKLVKKYGINATNADKIKFFSKILEKPFGALRLWGSGALGYIQKILGLWRLLTPAGRAAYAAWFAPTQLAGWIGIGASGVGIVILTVIIWAYKDDLAELHENLKIIYENRKNE